MVSGSIESASGLEAELPQHFIGRVNANTATVNGRRLIVGEFRFKWPETGDRIDRIDIDVTGTAITAAIAEVTFVDTAHDRRFGPFTAERSSTFFHDVEVDLDREAGALPVEPSALTPIRIGRQTCRWRT